LRFPAGGKKEGFFDQTRLFFEGIAKAMASKKAEVWAKKTLF